MPLAFWKSSAIKKQWVSIGWTAQFIAIAQIERMITGKPKVHYCHFFERGDDDTNSLQRLREQFHLRKMQINHLIDPNVYQFLQIEMPDVAEDELKAALRWRLKDMLDYSPQDATLDAFEIPKESGSSREKTAYVAVSPNTVINPIIKKYEAAHLSLQAIDIPELAQKNIADLIASNQRGVALLAFHSFGGLLTISHQGHLLLARRIDFEPPAATTDEAQNPAYEKLTLELQRTLDHCDRQFRTMAPVKIVIALGAMPSSLLTYLEKHFDLPVEPLDLHRILDLASVVDLSDPRRHASALLMLGAALRLQND